MNDYLFAVGKSIKSCVTPIDQSNKIDQSTKIDQATKVRTYYVN